MSTKTKTACILTYLKDGPEGQRPAAAELMAFRKSFDDKSEFDALYDGLPEEFKLAE